MGGLRKWMCGKKLQDAPIAQIRGGFINWDGRFAKVDVWEEITVRDCLFVKINRAYKLE